MIPLKDQFVRSRGQPLLIDNQLVHQSATIDSPEGSVTLRYLSGERDGHGIRLKAVDGWIELSDGSRAKTVDTWFHAELPDHVTHRFKCRSGVLRLWNVYRVNHPGGMETLDMWTGNAGMVMLVEGDHRRTYGCSRGGDKSFDPRSLVVEIEWAEAGKAKPVPRRSTT